MSKQISIGYLAERTGLAVSAIRFYEEKGLVTATRDAGGRRQFLPSDIRRLSFVLIAQQLGFTLEQIKVQLQLLPKNKAPSVKDWERMSRSFQKDIDARIETLTQLREKLTGCIGCGCLSLKKCALYNPQDRAGQFGAGPRYLMGDVPAASSD